MLNVRKNSKAEKSRISAQLSTNLNFGLQSTGLKVFMSSKVCLYTNGAFDNKFCRGPKLHCISKQSKLEATS